MKVINDITATKHTVDVDNEETTVMITSSENSTSNNRDVDIVIAGFGILTVKAEELRCAIDNATNVYPYFRYRK